MHSDHAQRTEELLDGRYRLRGRVGSGGMADVFEAEDSVLERTVAIKLIRRDDGRAGSADRAHTEKALLAGLNHPSVVGLYDAHLDPGSPQYLVMEFVDGPTLAQRLTRGLLTTAELAPVAADLAEALRAVHAAGVIHRDVKPSNVLLAQPPEADGRWRAKLADFGIACTADTSRARTGVVLGTSSYMAPEQLRDLPLEPSADIYALGLVLLECLTGVSGYPLGTDMEAARRRLTVPPEIPRTVPPGWARLISRMTQTDAASRPSASEVFDAVRSMSSTHSPDAGDDRPTSPLPAEPADDPVRGLDARPRGRRRTYGAIAAAATAFGILAAIIPWTAASAPLPAARASAVIAVERDAADPDAAVVQDEVSSPAAPVAPASANGQGNSDRAHDKDKKGQQGPGHHGKGPKS